MVTREQILEALQSITEPNFQKTITELQLVKDIVIKEQQIHLTYISIDSGESYQQTMKQLITDVLKKFNFEHIHIRIRLISPQEIEQLNIKYQQNSEQSSQPKASNAVKASLLAPGSQVHFIAIASGKGGVGKSTVTVNLAVALSRIGKKVGIIDADIYGFSIPDMMGIEEQPKMEDNVIIPVEKFGVKVISMGFFVQENAPVIWRGPMLGKMLRNFFNEVSWGELDFLLLDLPPGTGDVALDVHQLLPKSKEIIVTTPHPTASFVAARAGAMALHTQHEILGIIENMSYFECETCDGKNYLFGKGGGTKLANELKTELLAQIPIAVSQQHVSEAEYAPSVYREEEAVGQVYLQIAKQIVSKYQ
jgi:ATP-binding protein involved in chromosome partitioning